MPERVDGDALAQAGLLGSIVAGTLQGSRCQVAVDGPAGKQPIGGRRGAIPGTQDFPQARRQHGVTTALTLALLDAEQHALRVDVLNLEGNHLGDPQAGAVSDHERGAWANAGAVVEEPGHFLLAENDAGVFGNAGAQQASRVEGRLQGDAVKQLGGGRNWLTESAE